MRNEKENWKLTEEKIRSRNEEGRGGVCWDEVDGTETNLD